MPLPWRALRRSLAVQIGHLARLIGSTLLMTGELFLGLALPLLLTAPPAQTLVACQISNGLLDATTCLVRYVTDVNSFVGCRSGFPTPSRQLRIRSRRVEAGDRDFL
jgi:hypothetical protein